MHTSNRLRWQLRAVYGCLWLALAGFNWQCQKAPQLFEPISPSASGIQFSNELTVAPGLNILYYLYYYNGAGVAVADFDGDGLQDIYFAANKRGGNKLYRNIGAFRFEDITEAAGVAGIADWCSGVTVADVNADGRPDLYVCAVSGDFGLKGRNALYINKGGNKFTEAAEAYGLAFSGLSTQAAFFDYDHDGDLDCYLLNHSKRPHANLVPSVNRLKPDAAHGDRLYRNDLVNAAPRFTDVSTEAGIYQSSLGYGLGLAVADMDNDGWDDIYVGNDFHENDYLYINQRNGTFKEVGEGRFGHYSRFSMGNDAADLNNDGQMDLITVDMLPPDEATLKTYGSDESMNSYRSKLVANNYQHQVSRNCIQLNLGNGASFADVALMTDAYATDWSWSPLFADFDHDGCRDLFVTSGIVKRPVDLDYVQFVSALSQQKGLDKTDAYDQEAIDKMPDGASPLWFFKGNGAGGLQRMDAALGMDGERGYYNGAAAADFDQDGDLDLVVNRLQGKAVLLKNGQQGKPAMRILPKGDSLNPFGIGCKVFAFANGALQYHQFQSTHGFMSASLGAWYVSLPSGALAFDSVVVAWPDGSSQTIENPNPAGILEVKQAAASGHSFNHISLLPAAMMPLWQDLSAPAALRQRHQENPYLDFNRQYLIPQMQSNRGPALAVADVNGDGLQDFYLGASPGFAGNIWQQQPSGSFTVSKQPQLMQDIASETLDAAFFDANGDGFDDVYLVHGGGELDDGNPALDDALYLNNGKGQFRRDTTALPTMRYNKSCVVAWDADGDGDQDVFIGGASNAGVYGNAAPSALLLNNGKGKFSAAPQGFWQGDSLGVVTAAAVAQVSGDSRPDLIVVGEWMPVWIFEATAQGFEPRKIAGSQGLWQSVAIDDLNADGKPDILAGNWGTNSKRAAGKQGPLSLFVKDFDQNGRVEHIMAYRMNDEDYPFFAKDELERAVPELKKYYLSYSEVAGKTVSYMFFNLFKDYRTLKAERLETGAFMQQAEGTWSFMPMPSVVQRAPVFVWQKVPELGWLTAGNFSGVSPYEGRYDALRPTMVRYNVATKSMEASVVLPTMQQEFRRGRSIMVGKRMAWLLAANNDSLKLVAPANIIPR